MITIPDLISRLIQKNGGDAARAARQLGCSPATLSRYRSGDGRPRPHIADRLRALVEGAGDLLEIAQNEPDDLRLKHLEEAISETLNALREEFHRNASVSKRQDVLDLVSVLFFAHVTSIDGGGLGIGKHLV